MMADPSPTDLQSLFAAAVVAHQAGRFEEAGALGRPVWILSRQDGCWRWLEGREDSPWYPTARLIHQQRAGHWGDVIARLARELAGLVESGRLSGAGPRV